jgi:hypothetical protein
MVQRRTITEDELRRATIEFENREGRDSMYRVATFLLHEWWGRFPEMADALTVLLLTWNQAYYRYGRFDAKKLEAALEQNWEAIEAFRHRAIDSFSSADHGRTIALFNALLPALANQRGVSPVSVGKALHSRVPGSGVSNRSTG